MTQEVLKLALEALIGDRAFLERDAPVEIWGVNDKAITAIKAALAQDEPWCMKMNGCKTKCEDCPVEVAQQEPAAHAVIAGALFDFMGWLTSREERIVLSSADEASPAVDAISNFAKMRGLSLDDAKVQDWNTTPPQPEERNFCPRCGKRTADLTVIHTCTPPQENT